MTLGTVGRRFDPYWLGEHDADGEPPGPPEMTLQMAPGQEFLLTER